jgi:hypothetical protein
VTRSVLVSCVVVCAMVPSAQAATDLFGFTVSNPLVSFNGTTLTTTDAAPTAMLHVYRNGVPEVANLYGGADAFTMTMAITNVTSTFADGSGTFSFKDRGGEVIQGAASGTWALEGGIAKFTGTLSSVYYDGSDGRFDGGIVDTGTSPPTTNPSYVSMLFSSPEPWDGGVTQITVSGVWFTHEFAAEGGSVDAVVSGGGAHAPAPGALILALCGMVSTVGLRRRKSL